MKRLKRTISVFALLITAYGVYALLVVPFVEPRIAIKRTTRSAPPSSNRSRQFESLFPAGAWELQRPKVVETEQGTLMFEDYRPLPDGRMELTKCTVIAHVEQKLAASTGNEAGRSRETTDRRPVVIRAPQGAVLHFDQQFDVMRGEFGRLTGGQLNGEVTITSPPTTPGGSDGLRVTTRQLQIDAQRIWTPHEVQFEYGPNRGRGRVLIIQLASSQRGPKGMGNLGVSGVRAIELTHLEHLSLVLNNQGLFGSMGAGKSQTIKRETRTVDAEATPVDVACQGPLKLDLDRQWISLEDQVELRRRHPAGGSDQLSCQRLEIHFAGGSKLTATPKSVERSMRGDGKWTPTRVVATGRPVTIRAATMGIGARAERIEYDCVLQRVWLQDPDKVMFNDREREVEAREVRYAVGPDNRLGELWAQGPGVVRGETGKQARPYEVTWRDQVQLRRIDREPVLSFNARVTLRVADMGHFSGDSMHLYLRETPRADRSDRYVTTVDRLQALGRVRVEAAQWEADLDEARIWFKPEEAAATAGGGGADGVVPGVATPAAYSEAADASSSQAPRSQYRLRAATIEAVLVMKPRVMADLVIVRGGVELNEVGGAAGEPLKLRGEHFELQEGASARPRAALLGSPASIDVRGIHATGGKFHLHPNDNFFEIVGGGEMQWSPAANPVASPIAQSEPMDAAPPSLVAVPPLPATISWDGRMQFDGLLARFERNVAIRGAQRSANGDVTHYMATGDAVRAEMSQQVLFRAPTANGPVQLAEAAFEGWGFLQTELQSAAGERKMFEQLQVSELSVNLLSGAIHGQGPGWARGIHQGRSVVADSTTGLPRSSGEPPTDPLGGATGAGLHFLRVDFQREVAGNLHQKRLEFRHGTKTLYGPVPDWQTSLDQDEAVLPSQAVQLVCDQLAVMQNGGQGVEGVELEAVGNVHIRGQSFTATGERASYVRLKDQFVLEGDGRNDAQIEFQSPGQNRPGQFAAGKILVWPKTGQFQVVDLGGAEISDVGQLRGRGAPTIRPRR